jgi:Tol biopolymer transport system component
MLVRLSFLAAVGMAAAWVSAGPRSARTAPVGFASDDIAFASRRDGNWEIYVMDAAGRGQRRLTRRETEDRFPLWSPDHRRLAFASLVGTMWELWVMDSDGSQQTRLASDILPKSTRGWSSDSQRIAFAARADNSVDIYTVAVSSGRVQRLTTSQGENRDPCWSPDGTQLAFSSTRDGAAQIYIMNADGGEVRRLTNTASAAVAPRWSPDGKTLVFVSGRDLYATGADGRNSRRVTVGANVTADPPLWSPDGSRVVFQIAEGENYDIGLVRLSDGFHSRLAGSSSYDGSYTWSPDGKSVAFISGRDGADDIYTIGVDGQRAVRLTRSASLTPAWGSQR